MFCMLFTIKVSTSTILKPLTIVMSMLELNKNQTRTQLPASHPSVRPMMRRNWTPAVVTPIRRHQHSLTVKPSQDI